MEKPTADLRDLRSQLNYVTGSSSCHLLDDFIANDCNNNCCFCLPSISISTWLSLCGSPSTTPNGPVSNIASQYHAIYTYQSENPIPSPQWLALWWGHNGCLILLGSWAIHRTSFCLLPSSSAVWKDNLQTETNLHQDIKVRVRETALVILVELLDIAIPEARSPHSFQYYEPTISWVFELVLLSVPCIHDSLG